MDKDVAVPNGELACWLALHRAPGIGPASFRALLTRFGTPRAVLRAPPNTLAACGLPAPSRAYLAAPDWDAVERDLEWAQGARRCVLTWDDPRYPPLLHQISAPPPVLFVRGHPERLAGPQLAVVGSRSPTPAGARTAEHFAQHLAQAGLSITSGLALGIDTAAHRGALAAGAPTIAVTGAGPDRVYPARNRRLAERIAENGAVVSEFPVGTAPLPEHFPRRNRLISGLSLGTLVVEAAPRSGSLITARHAADQGREVFAVPGSIHSPVARGCHRLIREGAALVETADDVLAELGPLAAAGHAAAVEAAPASGALPEELDPRQRQVLEALGFEATPVDVVVLRTGLTAETVCSILLLLELQGHAAACPGGGYARVPH
ncbi:MAG: DNA-protecting protein DprA [Gammaproteobacteria bacterium]|nr:DNA-protecting protein DprA [Gammaproteobacteria bacterium]NIR98386.1 DNA-protecting protein DprA [Gammaproteobacteria bacterium]NIT64140.1 DNA-protecting protein DprA [Gammaproteobacteria bacterium]NIV21077.1 DNA-protecting protein DprA [Gammaproteobacteria bacterium]NIY32720.1 DNA-protecting protein DprA [Gammaproteobacteria bacterium]